MSKKKLEKKKSSKKYLGLLMILFIFFAFFIFAPNAINSWLEKYNSLKNKVDDNISSTMSTINKVKKLSRDINDSVALINEDIKNLTASQGNEEIKNTETDTITVPQETTINQFINDCLKNGITSGMDCLINIKDRGLKLQDNYPKECDNLDIVNCKSLVEKIITSDFIKNDELLDTKKEIKDLTKKYIKLSKTRMGDFRIYTKGNEGEREITGEEKNSIQRAISIIPKKEEVFMVLPGEDIDPYTTTIPAVLMLDDDNDGLPNEMEVRLGTDPQKADTDNDGYSDYIEVKNNYSPLGIDQQREELSPVEKAIINKATFEQPLSSTKPASETLKINEIKNKKSLLIFNKGLEISGQAKANEVIALYIYSTMPIVITIKTDANGNWVYNFDKTLIDGSHKAYVVINNSNGKIESKSSLFNFFIKNAIAVDSEEYLRGRVDIIDRTNLMLLYYLLAGVILIIFLSLLFIVYDKFGNRLKIANIKNIPQKFYNNKFSDINKTLKEKSKK